MRGWGQLPLQAEGNFTNPMDTAIFYSHRIPSHLPFTYSKFVDFLKAICPPFILFFLNFLNNISGAAQGPFHRVEPKPQIPVAWHLQPLLASISMFPSGDAPGGVAWGSVPLPGVSGCWYQPGDGAAPPSPLIGAGSMWGWVCFRARCKDF